jgi:pimeloyl-ACP methyl ester carboxylesterase
LTPVLFVHGMAGGPRQFESLIAGLDRERYQSWVFYYPSGSRLIDVSDWLTTKTIELRQRLRFKRLILVAHSMGGLVSREFIVDYSERTGRDAVTLFVSISTPWGGDRMAGLGTQLSPERRTGWASWRDLAPGSPFLRGLFRKQEDGHEEPRRLPPGVIYHLIFGFPDSVVPLESALTLAEYEEASVRRFPLGHVEILQSPEVGAYLNELLERARD